MNLNDITLEFGTDKSSAAHNYAEKYEFYFQKLKDKKIKILEIGIQNGFSLKTWEAYFPLAEIYGLDVVDCSHINSERIKTIIGNQSNETTLEAVNKTFGPFDIIIDDGSHQSSDMRTTFDFLFPLLRLGGIYVVEDLHCCYWRDFSQDTKFMDRMKDLLDVINANGKCGFADPRKIKEDNYYNTKNERGPLTTMEKEIEFLHIYRSIVFIKKQNEITL